MKIGIVTSEIMGETDRLISETAARLQADGVVLAGIAEAVAAVEHSGIAGAGLFVLNKFGPQEAEGHGFCEAIGAALEHDIPVLVGVGKGSRAGLERFVDGMGEALPPEPDAIYAWCKGAMGA